MHRAVAHALSGAYILAAIGTIALTAHAAGKRNDISRELMPYVMAVDKQPGLSRTDVEDFARRAGVTLSERECNNPGSVFCNYYSSATLRKALDSYKSVSQ